MNHLFLFLQLRQLCGRKDRKAASQLIDVRGDSLVMNSQEWLMQSLSEEKVQKSHKKNKKDGPSTMEKRKHQITYLAHQVCVLIFFIHCFSIQFPLIFNNNFDPFLIGILTGPLVYQCSSLQFIGVQRKE